MKIKFKYKFGIHVRKNIYKYIILYIYKKYIYKKYIYKKQVPKNIEQLQFHI